ncbi:hypothetical protein NDU88_006588, partial [Pleurodeles waltl]
SGKVCRVLKPARTVSKRWREAGKKLGVTTLRLSGLTESILFNSSVPSIISLNSNLSAARFRDVPPAFVFTPLPTFSNQSVN